jgi:sialate O-acetylesterase
MPPADNLKNFFIFSLFILLFLNIRPALADVRLPKIFTSNMVLQRDRPIKIWGWASPKEGVNLIFLNTSHSTQADSNGYWEIKLPVFSAGGPYRMTITGRNAIQLDNILIGDVWVCSGQSNMNRGVGSNAFEIHTDIRLFQVPQGSSDSPQADILDAAAWTTSNAKTVPPFSGVCYFFGTDLYDHLHVPIGLINSSVSNTWIQLWEPPLKAIMPFFAEYIDQFATLYNGMISPLTKFSIKGIVWYQGEGNVGGKNYFYFNALKILIQSWRSLWQDNELPFYIVQLAPYKYQNTHNPYRLPEIREEQRHILSLPSTGLVVTTDVASPDNLHIENKMEVGRRLSLWALARTYHLGNIVYSGPLYQSMTAEGGKIRVYFDSIGHGLASRDGKELNWFEVCGQNSIFYPANVRIDGDTLIVWSEFVPQPVAVRFGWYESAQPNFINKDGLPAAPFNTSY